MCRLQSAFRAPIVVWIKFSRRIFFCFKVQVHKAELHCQYFKVQFFFLGSSKSEFIFTHLYFWSPFRSANLCTFLTTMREFQSLAPWWSLTCTRPLRSTTHKPKHGNVAQVSVAPSLSLPCHLGKVSQGTGGLLYFSLGGSRQLQSLFNPELAATLSVVKFYEAPCQVELPLPRNRIQLEDMSRKCKALWTKIIFLYL